MKQVKVMVVEVVITVLSLLLEERLTLRLMSLVTVKLKSSGNRSGKCFYRST